MAGIPGVPSDMNFNSNLPVQEHPVQANSVRTALNILMAPPQISVIYTRHTGCHSILTQSMQ